LANAERPLGGSPTASRPDESLWATPAEILESIGEAFYAVDRSWRLVYINRTAERIWKRTRQELLGRTLASAFPTWEGSESHCAHEQAMATGEPVRIETLSTVLSLPVEINIYPSPKGLAVYFRDISDRKRAEEQLRDRDATLALAEQSADIGVWDIDLATNTVRGTAPYFRIMGLEPTDAAVPIEAIRALRHPDDGERVVAGFQKALDSGSNTYEMEYRIRRPDGAVRWIFGRGRVIRDTGGTPRRYSGIDIDVTELKVTEAALAASQERLRLATGAARMGHFEIDWMTRQRHWSPELRAMLRVPDGLDISRDDALIDRIVRPEHQAQFRARLASALDPRGSGEYDDEHEVQRFDGSRAWMLIRGKTFFEMGPHGTRPTRTIGLMMDISQRRQIEESLRKVSEQRKLLIDELNHRVKNTLATVQSIAAQTLRSSDVPQSVRDAFEARLIALANAHNILTQENWEGAAITDIVRQALVPHAQPERFALEGPPIRLSPRKALALTMGLHELATNAIKYGALSNATGNVAVKWTIEGSTPAQLNVKWTESGGPPVSRPTRKGFGSRLIERSLAHDLNGNAQIDFRVEGVVCTITGALEPAN
jgi:PAS domain S-box-containing protein